MSATSNTPSVCTRLAIRSAHLLCIIPTNSSRSTPPPNPTSGQGRADHLPEQLAAQRGTPCRGSDMLSQALCSDHHCPPGCCWNRLLARSSAAASHGFHRRVCLSKLSSAPPQCQKCHLIITPEKTLLTS